MSMESVFKLSVLLNMVDNLTQPMKASESSVSGAIAKLNSGFGTMQKAGGIMMGTGAAVVGVGTKLVTSTFDTKNALGELSSLGVKNLKAVENAAKSFSDTWAGTSKSDFITASYDIKSGIASLSDKGVAKFTELAALTGKATKSTTEEMGSLFATGYGIYKGYYNKMSDLEFGKMFSAGIATAVKNYKTSGSEMASSISALGATATNNNVPLEEQLAILGQLQTTMSGSEAATKYKSFLNQAAKAGKTLGLTFVDSNNQLLSTPQILEKLRSKYGDTIDAVEKQKLKEAFGTDEAVAMIDLLYNNVGTLKTGAEDLASSMKKGTGVTKEMAEAINNTPEQKFTVIRQQIHNNVEELAGNLLPTVNRTMDQVSGLIKKGSDWIGNNQDTVQSITEIVMRLTAFLIIAGAVTTTIGTVGKTILGIRNVVNVVRMAVTKLNLAFLASPVTWVVVGIAALIAIFVVLWNKSEAFRNFWIGLFDKVKGVVMEAWSQIQPSLVNLGNKLMELYQASKPILHLFQQIGVVVQVVIAGLLMGALQGAANAAKPLIDALSNVVEFLTNVVNAVVAVFRGDFSSAFDYAIAAVSNLKDFTINGFQALTSFISGFADGFLDTIGSAFSAIGIDVSETIEKMKNTVKLGLDIMNNTFGKVMGAATDTVKEKLGNMKTAYEQHGGGIRGVAAAAVEGVKGYYTAGFTFIDNLTGGKLSSIKEKFASKMSSIASSVATGMSAAKSHASAQLSAMHASYQAHGGGIRGVVAASMTGIRNHFKTTYTAVNAMTGGRLESVRNTISSKLTAAKNTVLSILDGIRTAFTSKLTAAQNTVSSAIEKIKSFFNFSWSLPKLKMPHFKISGEFKLKPPSAPKFDVDWYANGGILDHPTIFGQMGSTMLGGGEAGKEAVLPLTELWSRMKAIMHDVLRGQDKSNQDDSEGIGVSLVNLFTNKATDTRVRSEKKMERTVINSTTEKERGGDVHIHSFHMTVDINKIKDLPLLAGLIEEVKDAQNRTDHPDEPVTA